MTIVDEQAGDTLGSYRLERLLGEGTMGRVWAARHVSLDRRVAIKVLRAEHAANVTVINRFFDEARAVNCIDHEHIVDIVDFAIEQDPARMYTVMEYLEGRSLAEAVELAPLPVQAIVTVLRQICSALAAAHRVGVVHRDLKPDNVFLLRRPGAPLFVKVLDFGVAKLSAELRRPRVSSTAQGTLLGTPLFMAPEQIVGTEVDARADVYAVGCLLYWLLSGRLPFDSPHFGQLSMQVIQEAPPPLPAWTPSGERLPSGLADLALRCLEKRAAERPHSMEVLLDALERPDTPRALPKQRRSLALAVAAAVVLAGAAAWSFSHSQAAAGGVSHGRAPVAPAAQVERKAVPADVDATIDPFGP